MSCENLIKALCINSTTMESLEKQFKSSPGGLNDSSFINTIADLLTSEEFKADALELFKKVRSDSGLVTWDKFLDTLIDNYWTRDSPRQVILNLKTVIDVAHSKWLGPGNLRDTIYYLKKLCQRETTVKIVQVETPKYFCYVAISKYGQVGVYDGDLNFLTTYQLIMTREDITSKEEDRRRRNRWVTDAIFCGDIQMLVFTNSARSIAIYEASGLKHVPMWLILSTPDILQCLAYNEDECVLLAGNGCGSILAFAFHGPKGELLRRKYSDRMSLFYWDELPNEKQYVTVKRIGPLHKEGVQMLSYVGKGLIISCSQDPEASLVIKHLDNKSRTYVFKIGKKGVICFVPSLVHKIIITGSRNGLVRIWNSMVTSKPISVLKGHTGPVLDLQVMDKQQMFLSISSDGTLKLWDLIDQKCLQALTLNFPSFKIFGKLIEWGTRCLYPGPRRLCDPENNRWERSHILVTCCNHIACVQTIFQDLEIQRGFEQPVLPAPPFQNSVLIPKSWQRSNCEKELLVNNSATSDDFKDTTRRIGEDLNSLLDRNLRSEHNRCDINFKIAQLETKKIKMREHVARGAPYLALDLYDVENLKLSQSLPLPKKKKNRAVVENVEKMLQDASFRDSVFSDSSSPRSSRSSVVDFPF